MIWAFWLIFWWKHFCIKFHNFVIFIKISSKNDNIKKYPISIISSLQINSKPIRQKSFRHSTHDKILFHGSYPHRMNQCIFHRSSTLMCRLLIWHHLRILLRKIPSVHLSHQNLDDWTFPEGLGVLHWRLFLYH